MKAAARKASGVPVSRPRMESCAKACRSRASSAGSTSPTARTGGAAGDDDTAGRAVHPRTVPTRSTAAVASRRCAGPRVKPMGIITWLGFVPANSFRSRSSLDSRRGSALLYICIPVFNEAPTIGLVLWKLRKVLQEYSREYEVVIYDDGSTDGTRETLAPYDDVLPMTIIGPAKRQGYAAALDGLVRHVTTATRYPRRDAMIILQGDLTDQPDDIPELTRRFEGGADIIVAERATGPMPQPVEKLRKYSGWMSRRGTIRVLGADRVVRPALFEVPGVADPFGSLRL